LVEALNRLVQPSGYQRQRFNAGHAPGPERIRHDLHRQIAT
jgi:hypothetical protein